MFQTLKLNPMVVLLGVGVIVVLLVIFSVTAPLLSHDIKLELPQAPAKLTDDPLVVSLNQDGDLFIDIGEGKNAPILGEELEAHIAAVLKDKPQTSIMVKVDQGVEYEKVINAMVLVQAAGAANVRLITEASEG